METPEKERSCHEDEVGHRPRRLPEHPVTLTVHCNKHAVIMMMMTTLFLFAFIQRSSPLSRRLTALHTFLVHAGLFHCFHKAPNSDMDYRIFNVHRWWWIPKRGISVSSEGCFVQSVQKKRKKKKRKKERQRERGGGGGGERMNE